MQAWARSPKFILREAAIDLVTRECLPGTFLEVGAGTGALTKSFITRGFTGYAYDLGYQTRLELRNRFADERDRIKIVDTLDDVPDGSLDYLLAFEVLEHITDDAAALKFWCGKLREGGQAVFSVPAHQRAYGATDRRVGHVRRYDRSQLLSLMKGAGLHVNSLLCYGFPLGNLSRIIGNVIDQRADSHKTLDPVQRSIISGVEQSRGVVRLSRLVNRWTLFPFLLVQRLTLATDWGDGYVLRVTKRTDR